MHEPRFVFQTIWAATEMAYDTAAAYIVQPTQGDDVDNRDGDKIFQENLKLRGVITKADDNGDEFVRLVVVRWLPDNEHHAPTIDEILESTLFGTANICEATYVVDKAKRSMFNVLFDKVYKVRATPGGLAVPSKVRIAASIPLKRMHKFKNADADGPGQIYLFAVSNYAAAARQSPTITLQSVMQYRDV